MDMKDPVGVIMLAVDEVIVGMAQIMEATGNNIRTITIVRIEEGTIVPCVQVREDNYLKLKTSPLGLSNN